jgi:hypothetical protein
MWLIPDLEFAASPVWLIPENIFAAIEADRQEQLF